MELPDDVDRVVAEGTVDRAVAFLVAGEKIGPTMVDDLPKRRGAGTARAVDGGHDTVLANKYHALRSNESLKFQPTPIPNPFRERGFPEKGCPWERTA
jgi:hypothetical protein